MEVCVANFPRAVVEMLHRLAERLRAFIVIRDLLERGAPKHRWDVVQKGACESSDGHEAVLGVALIEFLTQRNEPSYVKFRRSKGLELSLQLGVSLRCVRL